MTADHGSDPGPPDGLEEKAAKILNATMVTAIGLLIGVAGFYWLWRFANALWSAGATDTQGFGWINLLNAAGLIIVGVQVTRFGARMFQSKRL